jgi:hypothetical protein
MMCCAIILIALQRLGAISLWSAIRIIAPIISLECNKDYCTNNFSGVQ